MPYILKENRPYYDKVIADLIDGWLYNEELVYILFEYCKQHIKPSYNNYKNYCGELRQCATEIERRKGVDKISEDYKGSVIPFVNKGRYELCQEKVNFMKSYDIKVNGDLNYILYGLAVRNLKLPKEFSEFALQLRLAAKKVTVDILAPYEDTKIEENGDVV